VPKWESVAGAERGKAKSENGEVKRIRRKAKAPSKPAPFANGAKSRHLALTQIVQQEHQVPCTKMPQIRPEKGLNMPHKLAIFALWDANGDRYGVGESETDETGVSWLPGSLRETLKQVSVNCNVKCCSGIISDVSRRRKRQGPVDWQPPKMKASIWGYISRIGLPLFLIALGIAIAMAGPSFWMVGALIFYVGAVLLAVDVRKEESFRRLKPSAQIFAGLIYGALLFLSLFWTFTPAPLSMTGESHLPAYPPEAVVGGIKWEPRFSELRVHIENNTPYDYSNVVVRIETDLGIQHLRPMENFLNCAVFPDEPPMGPPRVTSRWTDEQGKWHEQEGVPSPGQGVSAWAYRIACDKLPHETAVDLVGALFNQNFSHEIGQPLYLPPRAARWVKLNATYDFRHSRAADVTYCFSGGCIDSLAPPSRFRTDPETIIGRFRKEEDDSTSRAMTIAVAIYAALILLTPFAVWITNLFSSERNANVTSVGRTARPPTL
jgi:hypothetical protein